MLTHSFERVGLFRACLWLAAVIRELISLPASSARFSEVARREPCGERCIAGRGTYCGISDGDGGNCSCDQRRRSVFTPMETLCGGATVAVGPPPARWPVRRGRRGPARRAGRGPAVPGAGRAESLRAPAVRMRSGPAGGPCRAPSSPRPAVPEPLLRRAPDGASWMLGERRPRGVTRSDRQGRGPRPVVHAFGRRVRGGWRPVSSAGRGCLRWVSGGALNAPTAPACSQRPGRVCPAGRGGREIGRIVLNPGRWPPFGARIGPAWACDSVMAGGWAGPARSRGGWPLPDIGGSAPCPLGHIPQGKWNVEGLNRGPGCSLVTFSRRRVCPEAPGREIADRIRPLVPVGR